MKRPDAKERVEQARAERQRVLSLAGRDSLISTFLSIAETRRGSTDTMIWQVPTIALTGNAVLLSVIADIETRERLRLIATVAGVFLLIAALQLMLRHRYFEMQYSIWLEKFENLLHLPRFHAHGYHEPEGFAFGADEHPWSRRKPTPKKDSHVGVVLRFCHPPRRLLGARLVSLHVWVGLLLLFVIVDLLAFAFAPSLQDPNSASPSSWETEAGPESGTKTRFSVKEKGDTVLRLLSGTDITALSEELAVKEEVLLSWRSTFLRGGLDALEKIGSP